MEHFLFQEDKCSFLFYSPGSQSENAKTKKRRPNSAEEKADWRGTRGLKENMVVSGLVLCLLEPRLEAEEAGNPAMPIGTDKERPQEKSALTMQRTRERAA